MATDQAVNDLLQKILTTEAQTAHLLKVVQELEEAQTVDQGSEVTSPQVQALRIANAKLRYQIQHLKQSIAEEEGRTMRHMTNVLGVVNGLFTAALRTLHPEFRVPKAFVQWDGGKFGDYKCNVLALTQELKVKGQNTPPREVASQILSQLKNYEPFLGKVDVAGPGFINISLKPSFVSELVSDLLVGGVRPPPVKQKLRVVVDFSSPNIAKEMHVGHLRSTIIGETVCRLIEFAGHDVLRLNHLGDWGTQFGMLISHLQDQFPGYTEESPPIADLQAFYKESKLRFDNDEEFRKRAYGNVVKLQSHDPDVIKAWELICEVSKKGREEIYERLGVSNIDRGESFYQPLMPNMVEDLESKGLLVTEEGRKVMYVDGFSVPLTVVKSDGGFTYATSDLAALRHRVHEEKADWLVYVVDAGQALHLNSVFKGGLRAEYCQPETRIDHMAFGVVLGEDKKKFKTRSGDTVRLIDLLEEGMERSLATLKEKKRDEVLSQQELRAAQRSVAYGCIKYADLCHTYTHDYVFSFDKMLEDRGNTAVYLLYAYTRIRSIARLANISPEELRAAAMTTVIDVSHDKELKLAKCLVRFPEVVARILDDLYPHYLCDYVYEVCTTFTGFYDACYCVEKDRQTGKVIKVNMSRLLLCEATAMVLDQAFAILGLEPVGKM